jgi:uncharacterized protein YqjF (DUF2071 family)
MFSLPKHPISMQTVFHDCILVNYAIQPEALMPFLPKLIRPELCRGEAFISIVIARMEQMRPAILPAGLGITYNQVVYRLVVNHAGERGVVMRTIGLCVYPGIF